MPKAKLNEELCKIYNQSDIKDHAKKKSMWGGSFKPGPHDDFIYNDDTQSFINKTITYADSLYKNYDEVLVNVVDIHIKHKDKTKKYRVDKCIIEFNKDDGYISILNTGQGMPVDIVKDLKGNPVYVPQLISTEFLAGSNNSDDEDRITGGVNGIGLSMVFNNSTHTILETTDLERKKYFRQETKDRLKYIDKPDVTKLTTVPADHPLKKGGTRIKFKPAYEAYQFNMDKDYNDLNSLFKARAIQIAAHTGIVVIYNGVELLKTTDKKTRSSTISRFASMFMKDYINVRIDKGVDLEPLKYPWDIIIGISNTDKFQSLSIVNGVYVKSGNHINYIRDLVIDGIKPKAEKLVKKYREYKKSMLQNHMFVIMSGNIPNPEFDSQTKTNISGGTAKYKPYIIKPLYLNKIWKMLEPVLIAEYMENPADKKKTKKVTTTGIKKYKAAKYAGKKPCKLLVCEGDSAETMTRTALTSKDTTLDYDYYGTFNIGGVPINARTKSTPYKKKDGDVSYRREKMLVENERWSSFEKVMNLNHSYKYESDDEFKTLTYTEVIMAVDQDLDGIGQICGLIISNIHRFWPVLIKKGVVKQFETPIKRAYPRGKGDVISFYTDEEHRSWVNNKYDGVEPSTYEIKYYKGLATHNDAEAIHMFKYFHDHLYTFTLDDKADSTFDIYYGKDPNLRKEELVKPLRTRNELMDEVSMNIPSSVQLKTHTKEFQLDNIMRKLPNVYDGLNPARRKAICGARKRFKNGNKELKVFQLAGYIAEHMNYHHGGASLESTLINMAQDYVGANNFPLLLPLSQFGSRQCAGKDAGAPRYIKTKLNNELVSALFREEDDYVIKYTTDEGVINEPINYMPIAPFVLMESLELPASGWKYCGFSRSWDSIYDNIKRLINNKKIKKMPFKAMNWGGELRHITVKSSDVKTTKVWSVGTYKHTEKKNTIEVTELPYRMSNNAFLESADKKEHILSIDDKSSKLQIDIKVKLKPGALTKIEQAYSGKPDEFDMIEDYIGIKSCMSQHLNMIKDGVVKEYQSYEDVIHDWYHARLQTYKQRFDRLIIIIRLRIEMLENVIRFVEDRKKYNFSDIDEEKADVIMKKNKFIKFDKVLLENPKFTPIDQIEKMVKGNGASYNYLYSINPKQQMEAARVSRDKKMDQLKEQYEHITQKDIIQIEWLAELKQLNTVITKAMSSSRGWLYGESKAKLV